MVVVSIFLCALACRHERALLKRLIVGLVSTVTIIVAYDAIVAHAFRQTESVEAFGIPYQQVARVLVLDGNMSEEDREFMLTIMPIEKWREHYAPMVVDPIKAGPYIDNMGFFESHIKEFLELWARNLPNNLQMYVDAFVLETFGFWAPGFKSYYGYLETHVEENGFGIERVNLFKEFFGGTLGEDLVKDRFFVSSGTLLWFVLFGFWLSYAIARQTRLCVVYLPALLSFATILVAAPVAFSLRYVFVFALGMPVFLLAPFAYAQRVDDAEQVSTNPVVKSKPKHLLSPVS